MTATLTRRAVAVALFVAASAPIQAASIRLTAEDAHTIKEFLLKEQQFPRVPRADYRVGDEAPASVSLQAFPQAVSEKVSATRSHKFFLSGEAIVVVDPKDNRIAEIIE